MMTFLCDRAVVSNFLLDKIKIFDSIAKIFTFIFIHLFIYLINESLACPLGEHLRHRDEEVALRTHLLVLLICILHPKMGI